MPAPKSEFPPIHFARGHRVVIDSDLARLYGVTTTVFNQAIRRNLRRFPADFVFAIGHEEHARLMSQIVISNGDSKERNKGSKIPPRRGGRRKPSLVFTEHGAIMAATILRSSRAVTMSVYVVRAFVRMREALLTNVVILKRLAQVDKKLLEHDVVLQEVVKKLRPLLNPPAEPPRRKIGFHQGNR